MKTSCKDLFSERTLGEWRQAFCSGEIHPRDLPAMLNLRPGDDRAWIECLNEDRLQRQLAFLETRLEAVGGDRARLPLYGIPFAVKDNIDVAGWPTTAACPGFGYVAQQDSTVVARLRAAGAIVVGKTNMDQFATGLAGTRSPHGPVPNAFRPEYISGGSSAGSASVVARGIVPFALGTDTAGSGRVPAGMNHVVGLKPTRGRISTAGVVPACRTLDCVSILSLTVQDAATVANIVEGFDPLDAYSRSEPGSAPAAFPVEARVGIPSVPEFFGDKQAEAQYEAALAFARELGLKLTPLDFTPFLQMAELLYGGPWVTERWIVLKHLLEESPDEIHPVVRAVVEKATGYSAADAFAAEYRRAELLRQIENAMQGLDGLMVPTVPAAYTIQQLLDDPVVLNSHLGIYTNFVNFADMCALALPVGFREDGVPAGVTLLASAWHDHALVDIGCRWERALSERPGGLRLGATGRTYKQEAATVAAGKHMVPLAVVGAHLRGMPLNHQLTSRGAAFLEATETAPEYRLFALGNSKPAKPGLVRVSRGESGASIAVEVWQMPVDCLGAFTAEVPAPLGIGSVRLRDGRTVKGFICEGSGLADATEITRYGGWRAYLASQ